MIWGMKFKSKTYTGGNFCWNTCNGVKVAHDDLNKAYRYYQSYTSLLEWQIVEITEADGPYLLRP